MPGLPHLPHDAEFEHQGQWDGDQKDTEPIYQTHRGLNKDAPEVRGTQPDYPIRYRED